MELRARIRTRFPELRSLDAGVLMRGALWPYGWRPTRARSDDEAFDWLLVATDRELRAAYGIGPATLRAFRAVHPVPDAAPEVVPNWVGEAVPQMAGGRP